jgi:signal transduction histidine kinase
VQSTLVAAASGRAGKPTVRVSASRAYLLGGLLVLGVYFLVPLQAKAVLYVLIGGSSALAIVAGARRLRARARAPWYLFAAATLLQAAGDAIFNYYDVFARSTAPFPSAADGLYLSGYPLFVAGMFLLVARLGAFESRAAWVDAAIITVAFALVQWVFLMEPLAHAHGYSLWARAVLVAYPAMDLLLVAALASFLLSPSWRRPAFAYLVASIGCLLVADELYGAMSSSYSLGSWIDCFWLLSYLLWGVAALHGSAAALRAGGRRVPRLTIVHRGLLVVALLTAPALLTIEALRGGKTHSLLVASVAALLALLVMARMLDLLGRIERLRAAERAARADAVRARTQLAEQNEQLRELDRLKDEFLGLVSHDLRTPLSSIVGYVELLLDELGEGEQRQFLEIVLRNSVRLERMINDLLLVAQLQAGKFELELDQVELPQLVAQAIEEHRPRAEAAGVTLTAVAAPVPALVADPSRLAQVLDNLISNGIKFTPRGGSVTIAVRGEADLALLEITDTGIGIPAAEQTQLCSRFFRATTATAGRIPGTGLGLYIVKAIAEAHGGGIELESREAVGTTVRVALPCPPGLTPVAPPARLARARRTPAQTAGGR